MARHLDFRCTTYAGGLHQPPHRHDELHLSLVLRGRLAETVHGHTEHAAALSVVAKDPDVVHADAFGPEPVSIARLSLPNLGVGALVDAPDRAFAWRWSHDPTVARCFLRLVQRAAGAHDSFAADDAEVLDLLAALTARAAHRPAGTPPAWLAATIERLRAEWQPGTRVAHVARTAGVHPVYLARCVRRWYGHGVQELLRRHRLAAAAALLARDRATVSEAAHATGFTDESHLCREFRARLSLAPGRYRAAVREVARVQGEQERAASG